MKALRVLRTLSLKPQNNPFYPTLLYRLYSAQPQEDDSANNPAFSDSDSVFDSTHYAIPSLGSEASTQGPQQPIWDEKYRRKADTLVFGKEKQKEKLKALKEEEKKKKSRALAKVLLESALEAADDDEDEEIVVEEEDQKSLSVGIVGVPNAGKSALTNCMVGTKVSAVSRKTNTTVHEVLGVMTKDNTQICFFDTPGLILNKSGLLHKDMKLRVESAWSSVNLYDVLIVIFDIHRHLTRPDTRVTSLIQRLGKQPHPIQKRILCMNKVDLVAKKKDLLKVAEEFKDLPGFERYFTISGLKGYGVKPLTEYLMQQAVKRPWDEDPFVLSEELMKNISLEVVREKLLDHVHQEIPYSIGHRLMDWKELPDGSLRIEQHLIALRQSQRKILVGKNGSKIGRIGVEANEELRSIFKREVHLILMVRLK